MDGKANPDQFSRQEAMASGPYPELLDAITKRMSSEEVTPLPEIADNAQLEIVLQKVQSLRKGGASVEAVGDIEFDLYEKFKGDEEATALITRYMQQERE